MSIADHWICCKSVRKDGDDKTMCRRSLIMGAVVWGHDTDFVVERNAVDVMALRPIVRGSLFLHDVIMKTR